MCVALCTMKIVATPYPRSPHTRQAKGVTFEGSEGPNQHYRNKTQQRVSNMYLKCISSAVRTFESGLSKSKECLNHFYTVCVLRWRVISIMIFGNRVGRLLTLTNSTPVPCPLCTIVHLPSA